MAKNKNLPGDSFGNNLDFLSKCSFCGAEYQAADLTLIEEREQKTTLHATCGKCHTAAIFFLSNNPSGMLSLGVVTDLDKEEVRGKFLRQAVSADEVIDAHQLISHQEANLGKLFKS